VDVRPATSPDEIPRLNTDGLRARFLVEDLMSGPGVRLAYAHEERLVLGGVRPEGDEVELYNPPMLRADYFLERREVGIVNVGAQTGTVTVDGTGYEVAPKDCLYVGRGSRSVTFSGKDAAFYLVSTTAHTTYPTRGMTLAESEPVNLGDIAHSNERTIHKFIHGNGIASCQLVLGLTVLAPGSMWNTMPCHTHDRRTEVYFYFDLEPDQRIVHLMGEPDQTRNLIVAGEQAVVSPRWSVHCGFGTQSYAFVWAMGGENTAYDDVEPVALTLMR
jgi:4-deoxy-L-threo-5-hexosulose-uronate ketol-isomerase